MASFDIVSATTNAYKTGWEARSYLLRLAAVPFALKLVCFTIASSQGGEDGISHLRFMLIMLPALLAEGWMLSHFVRYVTFGQTWPFRPTGDMDADLAVLTVRARGVLSGMIVFALINMVLGAMITLVTHTIMPYMPEDPSQRAEEFPAHVALLSLSLLVFCVWGFRLFWLYVPMALNVGTREYLKTVHGWASSFYMMGAWILCFAPFMFLLRILGGLFATPAAAIGGDAAGTFVMMVLIVLTDTAKSLIATAGITYGLQQIFAKRDPA